MSELCPEPDCLCWHSPATLSNVDKICALVRRHLETYALANEDSFAIELLVREALTNAVMHGCKQDPNLNVAGCVQVGSDEVILEVGDEGCGFAWNDIMLENTQDLSETGRGLAIYRLCSSAYQFNTEGNRVTFRRNLKKGLENG